MNILVTGACGFLGKSLVFRLAATDDNLAGRHNVFALFHDRQRQGMILKTAYIHGDVTDYRRMLEIIVDIEIDQIYHCAAKSIVRNCRCDPLGCFQTNVMGTANLLEAARQSERVKGILLMESDKAYGPGPIPYKEDQRLEPAGVYEASKACVTHLMRSYHKNYGVPVFSIRSANVYGPRDTQTSRLVPNTITRLLRGEPPQITAGAEDYVREFIYVDDFVSYATRLMAVGPWGEAVNVGTGQTFTTGEVVDWICYLMDKAPSAENWPKPPTLTEIPQQRVCLDKLKGLVPDVTPKDFRQGLEETIKWHS